MEGWIKLHRKITTWEWWDDHNTTRLFVGFPSQKGSDDEYHDTVWAEKEVRDMVNDIAKKEYESEQEVPVMADEEVQF